MMLSIFSCVYWSFMYLLWKKRTCLSSPFPISLGCLSFLLLGYIKPKEEKHKSILSTLMSVLCVSFAFMENTSLLTFLVTKCVEILSHTKQFSATPAGCPTIQLNSDTVYTKIALDPTVHGFIPTSDASSRSTLSPGLLTNQL